MAKVYFQPVGAHPTPQELSAAARELFDRFVAEEKIALEAEIPIKVHFGEKGNRTYLKPALYDGIIDSLEERGIKSCFIETSVLYGGERFERDRHIKLAHDHGFTRLPVVIADGARGEEAVNVEINQKHFRTCSIAKALAESEQVLVVSHFKGHRLAGFGGALKQLSMGFASKGGKMAMHLGVKPKIRRWKCRHCKLCMKRCQVGAITIDGKPRIDHSICLGCGACFSICPHRAISIYSWKALYNAVFQRNAFRERLAEYAYAASRGKRHLYLTFAVDVTPGCDCEPLPMKPCVPNLGIFASTDPEAIDSACYDAALQAGHKFKGHDILLSFHEKRK